MSFKLTKEDVLKNARDNGVEIIRLQFTDIFGIMKNVSITVEELERAMDEGIVFDGSSLGGAVRMEEIDMLLKPDPSTFCIYPWRTSSGLDARMICDIYTKDDVPFEGDPRHVLRKALKEASDMGYTFKVAPECEFFMFHTDEKGAPTTITHDNASYYDLAPVDLGEAARRDMVMALKQMGLGIEASHHEIAPGQHEIDMKSDDALYAADGMMTFRAIVRIIAQRHGLHATFMPKPVLNIAGSGLHINQMLFKEGKNAFYDPNDKMGLSQDAYLYMGGLLSHGRALTAITNPTVNSYKRLVSGYDAPLFIAWSAKNPGSLVKVPFKRGDSTMIELRNPDSSCNPYLALGAILKCGINGIKNNITAPASIDSDTGSIDDSYRIENNVASLPDSLEKAINCLKEDNVIKNLLGEYIYSSFVEAKMIEWQEYIKQITSWEIEQYLTKF
jgi:glutamine synthetase